MSRNKNNKAKNPEQYAKSDRDRYARNPEKQLARCKKRYWDNPKKKNEAGKKWRKTNPEKVNANAAFHRARKIQATPSWANIEEINRIYEIAKWVSNLYQTSFHVDHIVPLKGKFVCGLHVENNLQIIPAQENLKKQNSFTVN